jgi:hypothetical protein
MTDEDAMVTAIVAALAGGTDGETRLIQAMSQNTAKRLVREGIRSAQRVEQQYLTDALRRARDYIDDCGAQAGAQAAIDDIEAVLKRAERKGGAA